MATQTLEGATSEVPGRFAWWDELVLRYSSAPKVLGLQNEAVGVWPVVYACDSSRVMKKCCIGGRVVLSV